MTEKRNQRLDLYRCLAAYSVVFLHIMFPGYFGVSVNCLARCAVPLFFLSAGYFSFEKSAPTLLRRGAHSALLLALACIPPAAIDLHFAMGRGETLLEFLRWMVSPANIRRLLTVQVLPFTYSSPLWFLAALVMAYLIWWLLTLLCRGRPLPCSLLAGAAAGGLALHLWLGEGRFFRGLPPAYFLHLRNVWLDGLPFFALGVWMHSRQDRLRRTARPWAVYGLLMLGAVLALWERWRTDFFDLHLGSVLMALAAMAAAVCWPEVKRSDPVTRLLIRGGAITFPVYALHIPTMYVLETLAAKLPALAWTCRPWTEPLSVAVVTTLLALALLYIKRLWTRVLSRTP